MIARSITIGILALATTAATCRDPAGPGPRVRYDLEQARALWEAHGPTSYRYDYRDVCFCAAQHYRVTVVDGAVADVAWIGDAPPFAQGPVAGTIDALFDRLEAGLEAGPHDAELFFHPDLGYPVEAHVDPHENVIDEEWGFLIENFRSLD